MYNDEIKTVEKIGDYKKQMKAFVKGLVKSKLFQNEDGDLTVNVTKNFDKELNQRVVILTVTSSDSAYTATFTCEVATRIFNKVDPTLFEALGEQLSRTKNFGKLVIK